MARGVGETGEFRMRGGEVSRIEGFSDAVFAFAVTLLVVSLEVPKTFDELAAAMRGFMAFAICFAMLFAIWIRHYVFFRRYGLDDAYTKILTGVLLFVVLFYTYPLKFLFTLLVDQFIWLGGSPGGHAATPVIEPHQIPSLMMIYGAGYAAVMLVFVLLYVHALRKRPELDLDAREVSVTRSYIEGYAIEMLVPVGSIAIAGLGGPRYAGLAGWFYIIIGPLRAIHGTIASRRTRALAGKGRPGR